MRWDDRIGDWDREKRIWKVRNLMEDVSYTLDYLGGVSPVSVHPALMATARERKGRI